MQNWRVDYDYIKTLGMQIIKGRNFSRDFGGDSASVIINETTAKILGYADPIGKKIYTTTDAQGHTMMLIQLLVLLRISILNRCTRMLARFAFLLGGGFGSGIFKVNTSNIQNLIAQIQNKWKALAPGLPFSYNFLNESFDEMYRAEQRVGKIALIFSVLAIFIACLGFIWSWQHLLQNNAQKKLV